MRVRTKNPWKVFLGCVVILGALKLASFLPGCTPDFNGSILGNSHEYQMKFSALNITQTHELSVEEGDEICAEIIPEKGTLSVTIQRENDPPVYQEESLIETTEFQIEAEKSGTYTVTVTGKKAMGRVYFNVCTSTS